jgi:hypothetical protein
LIEKKDLRITKHAGDKMIVEGITARQICEAIERGNRFTQTEGYLSVYTYFSVAWKKINNKYKIKTVFLNRGR